mmetsp:Transcript_43552/g.44067  ORF Transcript_43552/g.44067 Transcript_43552/m.44067 type:complete len:127 (-) Transcript_43552:223-603(-)
MLLLNDLLRTVGDTEDSFRSSIHTPTSLHPSPHPYGTRAISGVVATDMNATRTEVSVVWAGITVDRESVCLGLSQIREFDTFANLVEGVAQETLSFLLPALIAVTYLRWDEVHLLFSQQQPYKNEL